MTLTSKLKSLAEFDEARAIEHVKWLVGLGELSPADVYESMKRQNTQDQKALDLALRVIEKLISDRNIFTRWALDTSDNRCFDLDHLVKKTLDAKDLELTAIIESE